MKKAKEYLNVGHLNTILLATLIFFAKRLLTQIDTMGLKLIETSERVSIVETKVEFIEKEVEKL